MGLFNSWFSFDGGRDRHFQFQNKWCAVDQVLRKPLNFSTIYSLINLEMLLRLAFHFHSQIFNQLAFITFYHSAFLKLFITRRE